MVEVDPSNCISYEVLSKGLDGDLLVIDVRNPDEISDRKIKSKRWLNVPISIFEEDMKLTLAEFQKKHNVNFLEDGSDVVFNCGSGKRSSRALKIALEKGCNKARHFPGGYGKYAECKSQGV